MRLGAALDRGQWRTVAAMAATVLTLRALGSFPLLVAPATRMKVDAW
jgi:hypothetical protein